jgi:peptidyl-prolyl cis-trans isomerase SurA
MRCSPYGFFIFLFFTATHYVSAKINNTIGSSTDESFIYKLKKNPKIISDKDDDIFTVLKRTSAKSKKELSISSSKFDASNTKFFPVVTVNNDVITNIDVLNAMKFVCFSSGKMFKKDYAKSMLRPILGSMITDKLQGQYAKCLGAEVSKTDIDEKVTEIAANNGLSVEQLIEEFKKFEISMEIFRKNICSKMLLPFVVQAFTENSKISDQELKEKREKERSILQHTRYQLIEISFKIDDRNKEEVVKKNAESILDLIKDGFSVHVLASVLSQDVRQSTFRWVTEQSIEKTVRNSVTRLSPGEYTDIIRTKTGYKIIFLLDKAEPGKAGALSATYKILYSQIKCSEDFFTQKDMNKTKEKFEALKQVSSPEDFKNICKEHNIEYEEMEISEPNGYHMELINTSMKNNAPAMVQSPKDSACIDVVMFVSKKTPDAQIPNDETLREQLSSEKLEKDFDRNFKRMSSYTHVTSPDQSTLDKIIQ